MTTLAAPVSTGSQGDAGGRSGSSSASPRDQRNSPVMPPSVKRDQNTTLPMEIPNHDKP
jgi:hypothetical protein